MVPVSKRQRLVWLSAGLLLGVVAAGIWPDSPAHAVATAQYESFAICTAPVDEEGEGIFFLDSLTGDLKGAVLNPQSGKFTVLYTANVVGDLGVDIKKSPKYLMVSGGVRFRRSAGTGKPGDAVIYVAELTSGKVGAYGIPWDGRYRTQNQIINLKLQMIDGYQFRDAVQRN